MSASPSALANGQSQDSAANAVGNPNGAPRPRPIKRRPRTDPMVARKRPQPKAADRPGPAGATQTNVPAKSGPSTASLATPEAQTTNLLSRIADYRSKTAAYGGWSEPLPEGGHEWKIVTSKRALTEGMRYHVMRFSSAKAGKSHQPIDPTNQDDFTRPVTLQRRDPRQPAPGRETKQPELPPEPEPTPQDEKEAERIAKLKAEKDAWRAMEAAKSAPSIKDPAQKAKQPKQEDPRVQFHRAPRSEAEKKQQELRYEESLPWHLEDADGKNVWVGSYVAPLSETNVCFVPTVDGKFAMVPLEKWYKFVAKPNFTTMKLEEAEALVKKQTAVSRWYMQDKEKEKMQKEMDDTRNYFRGPARVKRESSALRGASREDLFDHDQIDFEGDEFQDDDEAPGFEPDNDEEQKDAVDRIRREQLGANLFGDADEGQVDKEELEARLLEEKRKKEGKKMTKALIKREKETIYQDDSDSGYDPFETSSSEDDSDEEKKEDQDKDKDKKDEEDKPPPSQEAGPQKQGSKDKEKDKTATPKGTLTPSSKQKQVEAAKKGKSLKRPGSPNLSESSGTESSRKKKLKKNASGPSLQPSRSSTPLPPGAAGQKHKLAMGSTSDAEATGGEMSDGQVQRKKKIKFLGSGARGTPTGSRVGSPAPPADKMSPGAASPASPPSRAGSPGRAGPVEAWEIIEALPPLPNGIPARDLQKKFAGRISDRGGLTSREDWINLVKQNCAYGPDKLLRRKE